MHLNIKCIFWSHKVICNLDNICLRIFSVICKIGNILDTFQILDSKIVSRCSLDVYNDVVFWIIY